MSSAVEAALEALRGLGTPEIMSRRAQEGFAPALRPRVNSHIHLPPNFSAFDSVEQALDLAADQGIGVLGVSNYYDYDVYADFVEAARRRKIFPLFGLEIISLDPDLARKGVKINDPGNPGRLYICGKGITRFAKMTPKAQEILNEIRHNDVARMAQMIDRLVEIFEESGVTTGLDEESIIDGVVERHDSPRETVYLQERHLCQAFQEILFEQVPDGERRAKLNEILGAPGKGPANDPVRVQNEIRTHLLKAGKTAYIEETFVTPKQAHRLILELGGIPCYPTLADGASPVCPFEEDVQQLIENIRGLHVHCAEWIPIRNKPDALARYVTAMRAAGLVITAGTEHNTRDLLPIEPACVGRVPVPDEIKDIFWEGACVVAAHQFLTLHGLCGFVDEHGKPNADYPDDETRINAFSRIGAAVIRSYHESN